MNRPKIGIALGAGGSRGFAHIGVIQELEAANIPIDAISGSSMGSLIGAFYVCGIPPKYIEELAIQLKKRHWLDFTVPKMGFVAGDRLQYMLRFVTRDITFEEAQIPFSVVATDVEKGERVIFKSGPIYQAVRASISIPGVFVPVRIAGKLCVDGGVMDRVPINPCREMGTDIVIGVDVGLFEKHIKVRDIMGVFFQTFEIMERELMKYQIPQADLIIRPNVGHIPSLSFTNIDECIGQGRIAAKEALPTLREIIKKWQEDNQ